MCIENEIVDVDTSGIRIICHCLGGSVINSRLIYEIQPEKRRAALIRQSIILG